MLHRIRLAVSSKTFAKLGGEAEIDETFIGGKAPNMHAAKRPKIHGMSQIVVDRRITYKELNGNLEV